MAPLVDNLDASPHHSLDAGATPHHAQHAPYDDQRFGQLTPDQLSLLAQAMATSVQIGSDTSPVSVETTPHDMLQKICRAWEQRGVRVGDVRLEGSGAAYCLYPRQLYNDLDIVFYLVQQEREVLQDARSVVLDVLRALLPIDASIAKDTDEVLQAAFLTNSFLTPPRTCPTDDAWALVTLPHRTGGPSLDLKFVQRMERPYQFSIDSFQIILGEEDLNKVVSTYNQKSEFAVVGLPVIYYECQYGNADEALGHLIEKRICVKAASDIARVYGGGLLKFALLKARGFKAVPGLEVSKLERLMCARFEIDYPVLEYSIYGTPAVLERICSYLQAHVIAPERQVAFLKALQAIVNRSASIHGRQVIVSCTQYLLNNTWLSAYSSGGVSNEAASRARRRGKRVGNHVNHGNQIKSKPQQQAPPRQLQRNLDCLPKHNVQDKVEVEHVLGGEEHASENKADSAGAGCIDRKLFSYSAAVSGDKSNHRRSSLAEATNAHNIAR